MILYIIVGAKSMYTLLLFVYNLSYKYYGKVAIAVNLYGIFDKMWD